MSRGPAIDSADESGFTLMETLVAIAISSLILVVMGYAISESFTNTTITKHNVDRAAVSNFASRYFAQDIASATACPDPTVDATPCMLPALLLANVTPPTPYGQAPPCGSGRTLINIPAAPDTWISYVVVGTNSTTGSALYRRTCTSGTPTAQQPLGQTSDPFAGSSGTTCNAATGVCSLTIGWSTPAYSFTASGTQRRISG